MMTIPSFPNPGERITATFMRELMRFIRAIRPIKGPGINLAEGPDGTVISLSAETKPKKKHHRPFEVVGSSGDDYKFAIYVPEHVVAIGKENDIDPDGITEIDDAEDWYMLDDEDEVRSSGKTLYLIAYDDKTAEFKFEIPDSDSGSASEDHKIVGILPIAELKTQAVGQTTVGCVVRQLACHPFSVGTGGGDFKLPIRGDAPEELDDDQMVVAKRFDTAEHQLQVKVRGLEIETIDGEDYVVALTPASEWLMIDGGQAVAHVSHDY